MNEEFRFNVSSVVVDDLAGSGATYEVIGTRKVWEGEHPFFRTKAVTYATQKGGAQLLHRSGSAHPAIESYAGAKERNFHINLLVKDLASQRARAQASPYANEVTEPFDGPCGRSFLVRLKITGGYDFWFEFTEGHNNLVSAQDSAFECVDSTAMVAAKRDDLIVPFASLGLTTNDKAGDGYFDVLEGINSVIMLEDWHYLEVNEPTKPGVMVNFLQRIGRPGIFGTNFVPRNMSEFVEAAKRHSVDTNTETPILLMVEVKGTQYKCADIVTINPRATGGGRIFILKPLEYPWELVA